jgi:hypothetical protein
MKHRKMQRHHLAALIPLFVALSGPASAQSITAITAIPQAGNNIFKNLGHGLQVATICHDGGSVRIAFQNLGSDDATLNWWYGMHPYKAQPTGTSPGLVNASGVGVNAYGVVVRGGGLYEMDFWFIDVQIEGQFIFANNEGNTTVNLHAFDGTTFCEVRGTAVFAPNGPGLKVAPGVFAYPNGLITKDKAAQ